MKTKIGFRSVSILQAAVCIVIMFFSFSLHAADYYVRTDGNDEAAGTSDETAWASIARVNQFAENPGFSDGDTINFKRGCTWSNDEPLGIIGGTGDYAHRPGGTSPTWRFVDWGEINGLTIQAYGTGTRPWLNGNTQQPIYIYDSDPGDAGIVNLTIRDIDVSGAGWWDEYWAEANLRTINCFNVVLDGIYFDGHKGATTIMPLCGLGPGAVRGDLEIRNCELKNGIGSGQELRSWLPYTPDVHGIIIWNGQSGVKLSGTVLIHDNVIHDFEADCIQMGGVQTTARIYNNTFYNFGEDAIDVKCCDGLEIYDNEMYRGAYGTGGTGGGRSLIVIHTFDYSSVCRNYSIHDNYFHTCNYIGLMLNNGTDVSVYRNRFEGITCGIQLDNNTRVNIFNNVFDLSSSVTNPYPVVDAGIYVSGNYQAGSKVYNNTFVLGPSHRYGMYIRKSGVSVQNNIFYCTRNNSDTWPIRVSDDTTPTLSCNVYYNPGHSNRVYWNGTAYSSSQQSSFQSARDAAALFGDPGLKDVSTGQLYAAAPESIIVDSGNNLSADISETNLGLSPASLWSGGYRQIYTVSRLDNGGYDIGAFEDTGYVPPAAGNCPALYPEQTYALQWGGEFENDTTKACIASGTASVGGEISGSLVSPVYNLSGYMGARISAQDHYISWPTAGTGISSTSGTLRIKVNPRASTGISQVFEYRYNSDNLMYGRLLADGTVQFVHKGADGANRVELISTATLTDETASTLQFAWDDDNDRIAVKVDENAWEIKHDETVSAFSAESAEIVLGEKSSQGPITDEIWLDDFAVYTTYQATADAPAAIGNNYKSDPDCKAVWLLNNNGSGGLDLADEIGNHNLTNQDATLNTTSPPEGDGWADFNGSTQYLSVASASNLPIHSDATNTSFTVAGWFQFDNADSISALIAKYNSASNLRSFYLGRNVDHAASVYLGYNSGTQYENPVHASALPASTPYYISASFDGSTYAWAIRIRDADGNVVGTDATGTATLDANGLAVNGEPWYFGANNGSANFPGNADMICFFDRVLTADEVTALAKNEFFRSFSPVLTGSVGVITEGAYDTDCTLSRTDSTPITIAIPCNTRPYITGQPSQPSLKLMCGPENTDFSFAEFSGAEEISDVWYLKFLYTPRPGHRSTDLQTGAVDTAIMLPPGAQIKSASGEPFALTLPETDIGAVSIAIGDEFVIGPGGDYESFTAFSSAAYAVPGDCFVFSADTAADITVPRSGTAAGRIVFDFDGNNHTGAFFFDAKDYITYRRAVRSTSLTVTGNYNEINYCNLTAADIVIPESAANNKIQNCTLYNNGDVDANETCAITNTIASGVEIASGKTAYGSCNLFVASAAAGSGAYSDASGSTIWEGNPLFISAGTGDFSLQIESPCIHTGSYVAGVHDLVSPALDLAGNPILTKPNIGCYQNQPPRLYFYSDADDGGNGAVTSPYNSFSNYTFSGFNLRSGSELVLKGTLGVLDLSSLSDPGRIRVTTPRGKLATVYGFIPNGDNTYMEPSSAVKSTPSWWPFRLP